MGVGSGEGAVPLSRKFLNISYIKMVSSHAFPEIFIDTVTALTTCFEHIFFSEKGTVIKRAAAGHIGHPLDPPLDRQN